MVDVTEAKDVFARAERILAETGFPPSLALKLWSDEARVSAEEWSHGVPRHDTANPAHRAAITNLLLASGHQLADAYLTATATAYRPTTLPLLRWELHAAGCVGKLERVISLAENWPTLDPQLTYFDVLPGTLFFLLIAYSEEEFH